MVHQEHPTWSGALLLSLLIFYLSASLAIAQQTNTNDIPRYSNPLDPFNRPRYNPTSNSGNFNQQSFPSQPGESGDQSGQGSGDSRNPSVGGSNRDYYGSTNNNRGDTNNIDNRFDPNRDRDRFDPNRDRDRFDPNRDRDRFDPNRDRDRNPFQSTTPRDFGLFNRFTTTSPRQRVGFSPNTSRKNLFGNYDSELEREMTYFVVASQMVRPGQIYRVSVNILQAQHPIAVRASISRDGVELSSEQKSIRVGSPESLLMRIPPTSIIGEYKLRVEGTYENTYGGYVFVNETKLTFSQRSMTIFVQTDKPVYMQSETVRFRTIPITTELKGFDDAIDVYMLDPSGHIMRRWLSRQSNLGSVSLEYKLADQPMFGQWKIRIIAQGQIEEATFTVEEYYQTRFEVNVTMPAFFFQTDPFIHGKIMANYTNGTPVKGNMTLKATIRPIGWMNPKAINYMNRLWNNGNRPENDPRIPLYLLNENPSLYNQQNSYTSSLNLDQNQPYDNRYQSNQYNQQNQYQQSNTYQDQYIVERYLNFDEEWPFWVRKPIDTDAQWDSWSNTYRDSLPYLRFFNGTYHFRFPMSELSQLFANNLAGMEVLITARVGERFYDEIIEGYAMTRIFNSSIRIKFLGESPQVFKPSMPFMIYLVAEYHDGSPLPIDPTYPGRMEISGTIDGRGGGGRNTFEAKELTMSDKPGVWELKVDLRNDLNLENTKQTRDFLNEIVSMRLYASYIHPTGERASAELQMVSHYSPNNHHIKVSTSTRDARVGEYIIFHVQSNFYIKDYHYLIMSKGLVLTSGQEIMTGGVRTMSVTLSAEMAPAATIVVWHIGNYGKVLADSLTFPVNGISRNNFTLFINNRKARTGEKVEVAVYGEAGSYVGLSAIDNAFYTMQAGNELTYANVITKMANFDEQSNGTLTQTWISHEGDPDELVYYPSSTFGIDANRTFEYVGLVIFSDGTIPRRPTSCDPMLNYTECLSGRCYRSDKRCDGYMDCEDGTDEVGCDQRNTTALTDYRKYRFNRILRHYQNVWLWKDINIGPQGRFIFNLEVPQIPAYWIVSAFGVSTTKGFGMLRKTVEYVGVKPFFINLEMPNSCRQGEQVGIRVAVFNYQTVDIEATVVLHGSPDYKFVHVEEDGIVRSYNPMTSFGEHQFYIYVYAQDSNNVYIPIVPARLGEIEVTIHASTLLGAYEISRKIMVEPDGLVQHRHQSMLLDLSNRAYIFQYMHVNVTETPIIPYQIERYYVFGSNKARLSIVGDVVGAIFPTMPVNTTSLLSLPIDSAEQNMFSFAANFYTIQYMRAIKQRNKRTEKLAFHYMNIGYQKQLSYMMEDGSFSLFRADWNHSVSSVWLTAYCARIFAEASFYEYEHFIYIDPIVIQKNIAYLLDHQKEDGSFWEVTWLPDRKANRSSIDPGNEIIRTKNITLTAHVLITLSSVKDVAGWLGSGVSLAEQKASRYIERNIGLLKESGSPYEIAIVSYALAKAKAPQAEHAFKILTNHMRTIADLAYWGNEDVPQPPVKLENQKYFTLPRLPYKYDSLNIETTAYALLTYVSRQETFTVEPIVRWLNSQRLTDGGWASSQDTGIAMKALTEYSTRNRVADVTALTVTVEATSLPGSSQKLHIGQNNLARSQFIDIPNAWGTVKVEARGVGYAILQMHVEYSVDTPEFQTMPPVRAFDLTTRALFHGRNQSHISMVVCQRWVNTEESIRSGMAVLDVAVPTGYIIQQQKLDTYILSKRVRNLQRARFQERKLLFYFEYLDDEYVCVNFTLERWMPVANMSRYLPIRVYDYHAPERFNETIFNSIQTYLLNICEVCGSSQCPYCSVYNAAIRNPVPALLLLLTSVLVVMRHYRIGRSPLNGWIFSND